MSFRGASADAFAALSDKLGAVDAALVAAVADDLFNLATVLREEPSLRRVATDVSTEAAAKQGLVREIFNGKVSADALDLMNRKSIV